MQAEATRPDPGGAGYILMFTVPAILIACALLGSAAGGAADWLAFLPLGIAFAVVPLLTMSGISRDERGPARPHSPRARLYYRALFAIAVAHELIHHRSRLDRTAGGILLSTTCFGFFKIVHLQVHHRFVGTASDFSPAPRRDPIYRFWLRCLYGNPRAALRCERERQRRRGISWWRSELLAWYGLSAGWLMLSRLVWSWMGALFFLLHSAVAILALNWTNYVQHYGLRRQVGAKRRYEPVRARHAWSMRCRITNLALLNLLRHGDHHMHPTVPYYALTICPRRPTPIRSAS